MAAVDRPAVALAQAAAAQRARHGERLGQLLDALRRENDGLQRQIAEAHNHITAVSRARSALPAGA